LIDPTPHARRAYCCAIPHSNAITAGPVEQNAIGSGRGICAVIRAYEWRGECAHAKGGRDVRQANSGDEPGLNHASQRGVRRVVHNASDVSSCCVTRAGGLRSVYVMRRAEVANAVWWRAFAQK